MKHRLVTIIMIVGLAMAMGAVAARGDESSVAQRRGFYLKCVDTEIENDSCKVILTGSRSRHLQAYGEKAALRTVFLSRNRLVLVDELVAQKVSMQPQAVQQYLRERFNQETHVRLVAAP